MSICSKFIGMTNGENEVRRMHAFEGTLFF